MNEISPNCEPSPALSPTTVTPNTSLLIPVSDNGPDRQVSLTPAQQRALECLFEGGSISEAAKSAGVARQTVNRWIRINLDFKTVYEAWHREIQRSVKDRMAAIADTAMDNIVDAIRLKNNLHASEFVVKHLLARKEKQ